MAPVALVTGASRRIGRAIAVALARTGHDIVVHHRASADDAETTRRLVQAEGRHAWIVAHDLDQEPERLLDEAEEATRHVPDVLVNNASTYLSSDLRTLDPAHCKDAFRTNTWAPFVLTRALAERRPTMSVVNVLDTRVVDPDPSHVAYALSKNALLDLTRLSARVFAPLARVNAVAPGPILPPPGGDERVLAAAARDVPLRRPGRPEDVGDAVAWLARAPYTTGQVLFVDGGRHLHGDWR